MDSSRVIKASAGTGKTYRLSIEIIALLFQEVAISEMVAVTFTKKATMEIKQRVLSHLQDLLAYFNGKKNKEETVLAELEKRGLKINAEIVDKKRKEIIINKNKFRVTTIDSFINSIFSLLIAPYLHVEDFSLIDGDLNEDIIQEVLEVLLKDKTKKAQIEILFKQNKKLKNLLKYREFISFAVQNRFIFEKISFNENPEKFQISVLKDSLDRLFSLIIQENGSLEGCINKGVFEKYHQGFTETEFMKTVEDEYIAMLDVDNFWNKNKTKNIKEELEEGFSCFKELLAEYIYVRRVVPFTNKLQEALLIIFKVYDKIKFKEKKFTYQDIAFYTYKYLYDKNNSLIDLERGEVINFFYEILSSKIRYLLIDEFQDTSLLQWNIFYPLISEIVSGNLGGVICVGDDKQAIYGWRGGERELLNNLENILHLGNAEHLDKSYRSSKAVISFVNEFFSALPKELDWDYKWQECHNQEKEGYVEFHLSKTKKEEDSFEEQIEVMVERFYQLYLEGKLCLKSTAFLFRTNKGLEKAGIALRKRNIPFVLESSSSILEHKAIKPIIYLLEYIGNSDTAKLFDFIRSDYLKYSLNDLGLILREYKKTGEDASQIESLNGLKKFLDRIDAYQPTEQIVKILLKHFNAGKVFDQIHDQKNIRKFIEIVRDFRLYNKDRQSIVDLLNYFKKRSKTDAFKQVGLETIDSVQLLTIHKSKGMEFDNVFLLWDLSGNNNKSNDFYSFVEFNNNFNIVQEGLVIFAEDLKVIKNHPHKKHLFLKNYKKQFLEEVNSVYVAFTRAKINLFVFCLAGRDLKSIDKLDQLQDKFKDDIYFLMKNSVSHVSRSIDRSIESILEIEEDPLIMGALENGFQKNQAIKNVLEKEDLASSGDLYDVVEKNFIENKQPVDSKLVFAKEAYICKQLEGSVIHDYLSCIFNNTASEHQTGESFIYKKYGGLFSKKEIGEFIQKTQDFISKNSVIFDTNNDVFNEHIVFDGTKEYRIDKVVVDNKAKIITIYDFKTGWEKDPKQLENYKRIIKQITKSEYRVETMFLSV